MGEARQLFLRPALVLWQREVVRFLRQRNRIIGALATPLVFWLMIGAGVGPSFRLPGWPADMTYLAYFFPGTVVLIVLFTAIFSTISIIEDRREGFLQGVLVAPVSPGAVVAGKVLGGTTLAVLQALLFCALAPLAGIPLGWGSLLPLLLTLILLGLGLVGLGFLIAWPLDSTQGFHAIMNVFLLPLWLLSGSLFPVPPDSWVRWAVLLNPVAYGTAAVRRCMLGEAVPPDSLPGLGTSLAVCAFFAVLTCTLAYRQVRSRRKVF